MPITLSDEALSRWLAEKLEPLQSVVREKNRHRSLLGVWTPINGSTDWQPRDMVGDPQMTLMLMEKMINQCQVRAWKHIGKHGDTHVDLMFSPPRHGCAKTLGRAVAEAFALANGYHEDAP